MRSFSRLLLVVSFGVLLSCSGTMPAPACSADGDCAAGQRCEAGACATVTQMTECTGSETRACGNDAIGACRRGTQRCVNGAFETACTGEVKPTAETCNQLDDDCDGQTDEGVASSWFPDVDGDGFGSASANATMACAQPQGFVADSTDCDDRAGAGAQVHPGATEQCDGPGVDENCNGTANEGCSCSNVGAMTPCCGGRGTQTCQSSGSGTMLSACSATVGPELCNALDDDCDGQVDEQVQFPADGGASCMVGQGACQVSGTPSCSNGLVTCVGDAGTPSIELCNGVDDDCDGQSDEGALVAALDGGVLMLTGGGVGLPNGTCNVGLGVCQMSGSTVCQTAMLSCTAVPAMSGTEVCNGVDDDCDGQTDEVGPGLCAVGGQICASGTCACPSGQSACNGQCVTLSAEVCDGLDNDCNGQIDEGVKITCLGDTDNDGFATNSTTSLQCPDAARVAFGTCPSGYVAPTSSTGFDCAPSDASKYRNVSSRSDSDADGYCAGTASADCVGTTALPGRKFATDCSSLNDDCDDARADRYNFIASRNDVDGDAYCTADAATMDCVGSVALPNRRFNSACASTVDCDDSTAARFQFISGRADADGDLYCGGASIPVCSGAALPAGFRLPAACLGGDTTTDCNDGVPSVYRLATIAPDADGDGYCANAGSSQCIGANAPAGYRMANLCNVNNLDCNDGNAALVRNVSLRSDADNDMWCSGNTFTQCIGPGTAPAGTQFAANCAGTDCRDTNANATSICNTTNTTGGHIKACGIGLPATSEIGFDFDCGAGFHFDFVNSIAYLAGADVSTESVFSTFGFQSGTVTVRAVCRAGAVGQKTLAVVFSCVAD